MKKGVDDVWWRLIVCGCVRNLTSASQRHVMATVFRMGDEKFLGCAKCTYDTVHANFQCLVGPLLHDLGHSYSQISRYT
jgi:hypothetical protein